MIKRLALLPFFLLCLFLVACAGETEPATNVTTTSADLNAKGRCESPNDDRGKYRFEIRRTDSGSFTPVVTAQTDSNGYSAVLCDPNNGSEVTTDTNLSRTATGLTRGASYEFRVAYKFESNQQTAWADKDGTVNGTSYERFMTTTEAPTSVTVTGTTVDPSDSSKYKANVTWSHPGGGDLNSFYIDVNNALDTTTSSSARSGSTTYSLNCGTTYNVRVRAFYFPPYTSDIVTPASSNVSVTTPACPTSSNILGVNFSNVSSTIPSTVTNEANRTGTTPAIGDQDSGHDTKTLAAALIYAKNGDSTRLSQVCTALGDIQGTETSGPFGSYSYARALAVGRGVQSYAIAASLVDSANCSTESSFRTWLSGIRDFTTQGGPSSLRDCALDRPNNWGTHCRASMYAADKYLGDTTDLATQANLFRSWVGDSGGTYTGFTFDTDATYWASTTPPKGINPAGATKSGSNVDGVLPDDQRRTESCTTNTLTDPCNQNYVYEALQGATVEALLLEANGSDGLGWASQAIKRALNWEYNVNGFAATGDDGWIVAVANREYGTSFSGSSDSFGKGFGGGAWLAPGLPVQ